MRGPSCMVLATTSLALLSNTHGFITERKVFVPAKTPRIRLDHLPLLAPQQWSRPKASTSSLKVAWIDQKVAVASVSATAKLLSALGFGAWATKGGVLDKAAISSLSRLIFYIFQPCFLCVSVGKTLADQSAFSTGGGPSLWIIPIFALIQISSNALMAQTLTRVFTFPSEAEKRQVTMCTTFNNAGPLPLIFSSALLQGTSLQAPAAAAISFYLLAWSPLFWTFGKRIVTPDGKIMTWTDQIKTFLSPPVIGSLMGMVLGGVPFVRDFFLHGWGTPVINALQTLGTAYLPSVILVLAGSLMGGGASKSETTATESDSGASPSWISIGTIFTTRFLVTPLLAIGLSRLLSPWLGPVGSKGRAILVFLLLMEGCMPPAQNSVVLLQLDQKTKEAASMARLLTILYSAAVVPLTLLLSLCLHLSGILHFT